MENVESIILVTNILYYLSLTVLGLGIIFLLYTKKIYVWEAIVFLFIIGLIVPSPKFKLINDNNNQIKISKNKEHNSSIQKK